ncbi:hypothetical protein GQ55_3G444500 [Panicum hallii var. hallii]|uniref:Uncharacterized protein n=1 Tax=Panicum hallii var. hallii TaxID=1504633 RepID=A0A2T7EIA3_9POAL|nr:hypothetical protein GQ55_3G444500 [Panicum hallii var. hallii]
MAASLPLAVVLLLMLLAASAVPATAEGKHSGGGRMVIIRRGPRTAPGRARANDRWRNGGGRLLEDEVAPELFGGPVGAGGGGNIGYGVLKSDSTGCPSGSQCAAKSGGSYTRECTYKEHCRH